MLCCFLAFPPHSWYRRLEASFNMEDWTDLIRGWTHCRWLMETWTQVRLGRWWEAHREEMKLWIDDQRKRPNNRWITNWRKKMNWEWSERQRRKMGLKQEAGCLWWHFWNADKQWRRQNKLVAPGESCLHGDMWSLPNLTVAVIVLIQSIYEIISGHLRWQIWFRSFHLVNIGEEKQVEMSV